MPLSTLEAVSSRVHPEDVKAVLSKAWLTFFSRTENPDHHLSSQRMCPLGSVHSINVAGCRKHLLILEHSSPENQLPRLTQLLTHTFAYSPMPSFRLVLSMIKPQVANVLCRIGTPPKVIGACAPCDSTRSILF